jgi:HYR domain
MFLTLVIACGMWSSAKAFAMRGDVPASGEAGDGGVSGGAGSPYFIETTASDPDWVLATSDRILMWNRCFTSAGEPYWYEKVTSPCHGDMRYFKLDPTVTLPPEPVSLAPMGTGTLDGLFVRSGSAQLYRNGVPYGQPLPAPSFVSIQCWVGLAPDGFESGTLFVEGDPGALSNYSITMGCRPASSMKQANAAWAGAWYGASTNGAGGIDLIDPWKARLEAAIAAASTDETQASSQVGSLVAPSVALDLDGNGVRGNREDLVRLLAFFQPGASNRRPNYNLGSVGCAITSLVNAANALKGLDGASQHTPGQLYELLRVPRPGGLLRGISKVGSEGKLKRWSGGGVVPRFDGLDLDWDTAAADLGVTHRSLSSVNLDVIADYISSCRKVVVYMNASHWVLLDGVRGEGAAREFLVNDPGSSAGPGNGISWISGQVIASKASRAKLIATRAFGPQLVSPPISLCVRMQDGGKALLTDPLGRRIGTSFASEGILLEAPGDVERGVSPGTPDDQLTALEEAELNAGAPLRLNLSEPATGLFTLQTESNQPVEVVWQADDSSVTSFTVNPQPVGGVFLASFYIGVGGEPFSATISGNIDLGAPEQGATVTISAIAAPETMSGAQFALHFDSTRLRLDSVTPSPGSPLGLVISSIVDNAAGTALIAQGMVEGQSGLSGSAALCDIGFTILPGIGQCGVAELVSFGSVGPFTTRFTTAAAANPVVPQLSNLPPVALDTTAPVLSGYPAGDITVACDAGSTFGALVPLGAVTATDNCDGALAVTETGIPAGSVFPIGATTVSWSATDSVGNSTTVTRTVTVQNHQLLDVAVELPGFGIAPMTRALRVSAGGVVRVGTVTLSESVQIPGTGAVVAVRGVATGVEVPVTASLGCVAAKDPVHSVSSASPSSVSGVRWRSSHVLHQGDSNDDEMVEIVDYALWMLDLASPVSQSARSNFNGDAHVNNGDFGYVSLNFFRVGQSCSGALDGARPRDRITVKDLRRMGLGHLSVADLNGDGWVDLRDIQMHMQGGAMSPAQPSQEADFQAW